MTYLYYMSFIFVFGPCWNNLETLKNTIENNRNLVENIKSVYITTNDNTVLEYYNDLNDNNIICKKFADNQGHQTSCFNAIITGMKMIIEYDEDEDVYVNDINLFNNSVSKFNKGVDIVCRKYEGTKNGQLLDYYMNDVFFIKKNKIKPIFGDKNMMILNDIEITFCENEFTKIISNSNIFSIPYHNHSTHKDSELGFHHIINYYPGIPFWNKLNIEEIYNM